eukprot:765544-Hanusia_phi.AAC.1
MGRAVHTGSSPMIFPGGPASGSATAVTQWAPGRTVTLTGTTIEAAHAASESESSESPPEIRDSDRLRAAQRLAGTGGRGRPLSPAASLLTRRPGNGGVAWPGHSDSECRGRASVRLAGPGESNPASVTRRPAHAAGRPSHHEPPGGSTVFSEAGVQGPNHPTGQPRSLDRTACDVTASPGTTMMMASDSNCPGRAWRRTCIG